MGEDVTQKLPLVSCIVTCFQKIPYLYEAVNSVLEQTYPQIELIVADDCSTGFSEGELSSYIDARKRPNIKNVIILHQSVNVGTVQNIRCALEYATGSYCVNLDGDDVLDHDTVLSEMIKFVISNQLDFLECGKRRCDEKLNEIELLPTISERKKLQKLKTARKQYRSFAVLRFLNIGGGSGMLYKKDSVAQYGLFDSTYRNWQDGPSLLAYVRRGNTIPVNHEIIAIKYRAGGVSNHPGNNAAASKHIGTDRMRFIANNTVPDRWNPYFFRRRRFMFYYFWENAKTKRQQLLVLLRFPVMGLRFSMSKIKSRKLQ